MSWALVTAWFAKAGRFIMSNRLAQIAIVVVAALGYHKARVWHAKSEAVAEERKQVKEAAIEAKAEAGDAVAKARIEKQAEQEARREARKNEDPRKRFGRGPFD